MPEGSYDTLAPTDEPTAPSAEVVPPANGQSNPNAPKVLCICHYDMLNILVKMYYTSNTHCNNNLYRETCVLAQRKAGARSSLRGGKRGKKKGEENKITKFNSTILGFSL